jgi:hypothetical protein
VEVKIGVQHAPREVVLESVQKPDDVVAAVTEALASGSLLDLSDDKGRRVVVPGERIAYVEIGAPVERRVGFTT